MDWGQTQIHRGGGRLRHQQRVHQVKEGIRSPAKTCIRVCTEGAHIIKGSCHVHRAKWSIRQVRATFKTASFEARCSRPRVAHSRSPGAPARRLVRSILGEVHQLTAGMALGRLGTHLVETDYDTIRRGRGVEGVDGPLVYWE